MTDQLCIAGRPARMRIPVVALAMVGILALPAGADAQPKIVKGVSNALGGLGDIGKGIDINPGVVPTVPKPYIGKLPTSPLPPTTALPGGGWVSPAGPQIGKLPPMPSATPTPPARPPVIYDTVLPQNPKGPIAPLGPDGPPIKYTGVAPDKVVPVRKVPDRATGIGKLQPEPNPLNFPVPVKVDPKAPVKLPLGPVKANPTAPVKLPGTPIASNPLGRVNLPPGPVKANTPVKATNPLPPGPPPQAYLALYGEDAAAKALRKKPSVLKAAAKGLAIGTLGGTAVILAGGGIFLAVECTSKDLTNCPDFLKPADQGVPITPTFNVTVENRTNGSVTVASLSPDGVEKAEQSPETPGQSVMLQVAENSRLKVYKNGAYFNTYAVTSDNWTIPVQ